MKTYLEYLRDNPCGELCMADAPNPGGQDRIKLKPGNIPHSRQDGGKTRFLMSMGWVFGGQESGKRNLSSYKVLERKQSIW